jgi:hypothetical protein
VKGTVYREEERIMRLWRYVIGGVVAVFFLVSPAAAYFDEYDDYEDAHPLRLVAYAIHPIGFSLEWLVTRPIHALVSQPELEPIFGHRSSEWAYDASLPSVSEVPTEPPAAAVPPSTVTTADIEDARRSAEEARRSAEEAKRAAEEAAQSAEKSNRAFERSLRK